MSFCTPINALQGRHQAWYDIGFTEIILHHVWDTVRFNVTVCYLKTKRYSTDLNYLCGNFITLLGTFWRAIGKEHGLCGIEWVRQSTNTEGT